MTLMLAHTSRKVKFSLAGIHESRGFAAGCYGKLDYSPTEHPGYQTW